MFQFYRSPIVFQNKAKDESKSLDQSKSAILETINTGKITLFKSTSPKNELYETGLISMFMVFLMYYYGNSIVASALAPDPRQDDWVTMYSPTPILVISVLYVLCVTWLGPLYMQDKEPFKWLKNVMVIFNILQVLFYGYIFYLLIAGGWNGTYSLKCQTCDYSRRTEAILMLHGSYWYFISKLTDLIDTIFFVLNKKYQNISLLHVIHHAIMPINTYFVIRYMPGGHSSFMALLNSLVHIVMYTYYGVSALGPQYRKYLWWKRYLTKMQITQFILVIIHEAQIAFIDCKVPTEIAIWIGGSTAMFLLFFLDFYFKAYRNRKNKVL